MVKIDIGAKSNLMDQKGAHHVPYALRELPTRATMCEYRHAWEGDGHSLLYT